MNRTGAALCLGFLLDLAFGDPHRAPHIVRAFGCLISLLERLLLPQGQGKGQWCARAGGICLVLVTSLLCAGIPAAAIFAAGRAHMWAGFALESFFCFQLLAARALADESKKIFKSLEENDLDGARKNLSKIVGRDTKDLSGEEIAAAAIESVSENTSDGVVAPMFYIMLGGGALGCLYKAVNTMDSMIGYKNEKYLQFGWAAAKLDDVMNYIPSRLSALLMIASAKLTGFDAKGAYRVWRRDNRNHASPNSAQTESACAGALGIRLGGPASYFGERVEKPFIGDALRPVLAGDITGANKLMYMTAILTLIISVLYGEVIHAVL